MSFEDITINHAYPIVNGFAQLPNNLEKNKTEFTEDETTAIVEAQTDGTTSTFTIGKTTYIRLPGSTPDNPTIVDFA